MSKNEKIKSSQNLWASEAGEKVHIWLSAFDPDAPLVVVPVFNAYEDTMECVQSLLRNTPSDIPLLVLDDSSTDPRIPSAFSSLASENRLLYIRKPENSGFVDTVNLAFAWSSPRDVIVVNSDVVVPPEWLERLRAAAYCMTYVATATPLTNSGTILSVPYRNQPVDYLVGGQSVEEIDAKIRRNSLRLYPAIPTAVGHCVYFRRSALEVVGYFDPIFAPGYGEEVDFSQRAVMAGFCHVVADDLFVFHKGSRSFTLKKQRLRETHERIVRERYPWYKDWTTQAANESRSSLSLAIERAQAALSGHHIAIDLTDIGGTITGTQVHMLELVHALAVSPARNARISIIIPDHIPESELMGVEKVVDRVYHLSELQEPALVHFHLVHRPFQLRSVNELDFLRSVADRMVISFLDLIAFSNPVCMSSTREWLDHRKAVQTAFNIADGLIFNSQGVVQEAKHWGLYPDPERSRVIPPGTNHRLTLSTSAASLTNTRRLPAPPFILLLGTSFLHKNRLYALRIFKILVGKYGWNGKLVFAGPTPVSGNSEPNEINFLQDNPEIRANVCYLGPVTEEEKAWLLKNASLLLYPSTREGFGLVPFEAAAFETPALTARVSALIEVLGDEVVYLEDFDPEEGAAVVWSFLNDPEMRAHQVSAIKKRMALFTWEKTAARTWEFYTHILNLPPRFSGSFSCTAVTSYRQIPVSPPQIPFLLRAVRRVAYTFRICANEWLRLFREANQYMRFLRAQKLTRVRKWQD